jgi:hypothetical protein
MVFSADDLRRRVCGGRSAERRVCRAVRSVRVGQELKKRLELAGLGRWARLAHLELLKSSVHIPL